MCFEPFPLICYSNHSFEFDNKYADHFTKMVTKKQFYILTISYTSLNPDTPGHPHKSFLDPGDPFRLTHT